MKAFLLFITLALLFCSSPILAQSPAAKAKTPLNIEAVRLAKERRAQARSLLLSLASDARSFRDLTLRTRTLARIADTLWSVDDEQGRSLFRKAWEAAESADENPAPYEMGQAEPNLRREVLNLVARRDQQLTEEFLEKLKANQKEAKAVEGSRADLWGLPQAMQQRLQLAESLLRSGDIESALHFADPVLGIVTISTVDFLTRLREKNPVAADQRYAAMLSQNAGAEATDANTISILSSYLFTPHLYVIFNIEGAASWGAPAAFTPPITVDPQLRLGFFKAAAAVLLRAPEQDQSSTGIIGKYCVVKRLQPLFDQYAPREISEAMRGQLEALSLQISDGARQNENDWVQKGIGPETKLADQVDSLVAQIERAKSSNERDQLYFKLALLELAKDDLKARDDVSKIEESGFRKRAQAWVDWGLAMSAIRNNRVETALEVLRVGDLTHIQRVWLMTQSAKQLAKKDREKALSLLDDANAEARRIDGGNLDRPRGLLAIANASRVIDLTRAWDAVFDAVKAANSTEGFTGEDGMIRQTISTREAARVSPLSIADFNLEGIFSELARDDYERVVQIARGFQAEAPRANATIAIARSALQDKTVSRTQPAANIRKVN